MTRHDRAKVTVPLNAAAAAATAALAGVAAALWDEAAAALAARTLEVAGVGEALEAGATGFARLAWSAVGPEGEDRLAADALSVRCLQRADGTLAAGEDDNELVAVVGRSY